MKSDDAFTCRSTHVSNREELCPFGAVESCHDTILLAGRHLALSITSYGRMHHVSLSIKFLSADGLPITFKAWNREWAAHLDLMALLRRQPFDNPSPRLFDLDIECSTAGRSASVKYSLSRVAHWPRGRLWKVIQPDPAAAPRLEEVKEESLGRSTSQ